MNLKFISWFFLFYMIGFPCVAQSKKDILKNKIKSITENLTINENGKVLTYMDSYVLYNKEGKVLEETSNNKDGSVLKKETFKYDNEKNKIEETFYHKKTVDDKLTEIKNKKTTFKYNANQDKTEEMEFDNNGKLIRKIIYSYNPKGEKSSETYYDGEGKLNKKVNYTYNNKSLKIKRECYRTDGSLESVKLYTYEFY